MKKFLLGAALSAVLLFGGFAVRAQFSIPQVTTVGATDLFADVVNGAPTAQTTYASAGLIGNVASVAYSVPLTAFTITQGAGTTWTIINPAGTLAPGTFTFNAAATNGARACFVSTQTQTAVTFTGAAGQTVVGAPTSMAAGTAVCFTYVASVSTYFKS